MKWDGRLINNLVTGIVQNTFPDYGQRFDLNFDTPLIPEWKFFFIE